MGHLDQPWPKGGGQRKKEIKAGRKMTKRRNEETGAWALVILKNWESGIHSKHRFNNIENMRSKLTSLNFNVLAWDGSWWTMGTLVMGIDTGESIGFEMFHA